MGPVEEVAIVNCLGEVRTALAGLEAAAQASLRANEVKLHELELRTARECEEARSSAEEDAKRALAKAEALEARVGKLEEKLRNKKVEAGELRVLIEKLAAKHDSKCEKLKALEAKRRKGEERGPPKPTAAPMALPDQPAEATGDRGGDSIVPQTPPYHPVPRPHDGRGRDGSSDGEEEPKKAKAKADDVRKKRRKPPVSEDVSCSSEDDSSPVRRKRRGPQRGKEARSKSGGEAAREREPSRSSSCSLASSYRGCRGGSPHSRERGRGREVNSPDSRVGRGGPRRGPRRSNSRRSRSRGRPWPGKEDDRRRPEGGKGKGGSGLCIPFVMGKCHWGEKCRDRHPDTEDAKIARENLQNKLCRFGMDCRRKDCIFKHPDGRKRDKA